MNSDDSCGKGDVILADPNDALIGTSFELDIENGSSSLTLSKPPESSGKPSPLFLLASKAQSSSSRSTKPSPLFQLSSGKLSSPRSSGTHVPLFKLGSTAKPTTSPTTAAAEAPPLFQIPQQSSSSAPPPLFALPAATLDKTAGEEPSPEHVNNNGGGTAVTASASGSNSDNNNNNNNNNAAATGAVAIPFSSSKNRNAITTKSMDGGFYSASGSNASINGLSHKSSNSSCHSVNKKNAQSELDDADSVGSFNSTHSLNSLKETVRSRPGLVVFLILILGLGASTAFLAVGLGGAQREQTDQFEASAVDIARSIEQQFDRYQTAAMYVHHYCRHRDFSREDFRDLYEYLIQDGLDFKAVQFDPNVTRDERAQYEDEARQYYADNYPHIDYRGFVGFDDGLSGGLVPTGERDFYFPIHYMEPVIGNEAAIDLDYYSHISRRKTLTHCMEYGEPALTERLLLVKDPDAVSRCGSIDAPSFGVVMMHPGVNLTETDGEIWPRDLSSIVMCVPNLLKTSIEGYDGSSSVYLHDSSGDASFLGGVQQDHPDGRDLAYLQEAELDDIEGYYKFQEDLVLTNKVWTVTIVAPKSAYQPNVTFVVLGAVLVLLASVCLALWIYSSTRRTRKFNAMKAKVDSEKAALILENTRQAARAERELNDFIAHEVRNPVAAAMAACSFVKSAVNENEPLVDPQKRKDTREDVSVIHNSLQFVNDLLRNMLDMHRASHKQLQVNFETIDVYHDILQSVAGIIYQRDSKVKVIVECEPQSLFVNSDCLRLKQVILNLSRNATKFVNTGFIKLRGFVKNNEVMLAVEDSGIGIPFEKQDLLFAKFQESLDQLSQGTGIGLYLCKNLVELMGGDIHLDKNYDSGVPGNPGASIIINLRRPPFLGEDLGSGVLEASSEEGGPTLASSSVAQNTGNEKDDERELPEHLNVLFVDDDAILRKLFARSVRRAAPNWTMKEASNGESALQLLDQGDTFDLIFVDQYMASIDKQMLGTETILEMRAQGVTSRLFGLSANDLEDEFIAAGADGFVIKPFPTETDALKRELLRAVYGKRAYYAKR